MTSGIFKDLDNNKSVGNLNVKRLKIFGLLHCQQTDERKAHWFYEFLQAGGSNKFKSISASDKDFEPNFALICDLACWDLFAAAKKIQVIDTLYTPQEIDKLKEKVEELREYHLIEDMFGSNSRLDYEDFVRVCADQEKAAWIFKTSQIREKIFKLAEIEVKHIMPP